MSRSSLARKLLIALATPLVLLGVLEAALFLADFRHRPVESPIVIWNPIEDRALFGHQGMFGSDPLTLWAPRPGAEIPFGDAERVNAAGFRGPEVPLERTPGVLRIATLGDSSTFGLGLPYGSCYSAQLVGLLAERGVRAEVLNGGVVGFTVSQGLERYRQHVRPYEPDVVVAAFGAVNEHHAAAEPDEDKIERSRRKLAMMRRTSWIRPERFRVLELAAYTLYKLRGGLEGERGRFLERQRRTGGIVDTVGKADWPGTRRVSVERFRELTRALAREVRGDGATLILVVMPRDAPAETQLPVLPRYSEAVREVAASEKLPLCDAQRAFREAAGQDGDGVPLFLPRDRWHPSEEGHAVIARELVPLVEAAAGVRGGS